MKGKRRMGKISEKIKSLGKTKGVMTHVVIGYPSLEETESTILNMAATGVSFIELQIPFSDPIADGPTIMEASRISLENGTKVKDCFELMERVSKKVSIPLLFMSYYNIVLNYGVEKFCLDAKKAGASGVIIPDIPPEESQDGFYEACRKNDLDTILILAPVSTPDRIKIVNENSRGFIYCTARMSTTGTKEDMPEETKNFLSSLKKQVNLPLSIGFGISKPEHVNFIKNYADIIVIGSKVIDVMNETPANKKQDEVKKFLKEILAECIA